MRLPVGAAAHVQLVQEDDPPQEPRHRPHALREGSAAPIQERLPRAGALCSPPPPSQPPLPRDLALAPPTDRRPPPSAPRRRRRRAARRRPRKQAARAAATLAGHWSADRTSRRPHATRGFRAGLASAPIRSSASSPCSPPLSPAPPTSANRGARLHRPRVSRGLAARGRRIAPTAAVPVRRAASCQFRVASTLGPCNAAPAPPALSRTVDRAPRLSWPQPRRKARPAAES